MQATAKSFGPRKKLPGRVLRAVIIGVFLLWTLIPVALIVITSFKLPVDIFTRVPRLIFHPTLINYTTAFLQENFLAYFINSVIVATGTTVLSMLLGTCAAYSLARLRVPGARAIAFCILICRMVPSIALVLPIYGLMQTLHLLNSYAAVIIAHTTFSLPFVIWMMLGFFQDMLVDWRRPL